MRTGTIKEMIDYVLVESIDSTGYADMDAMRDILELNEDTKLLLAENATEAQFIAMNARLEALNIYEVDRTKGYIKALAGYDTMVKAFNILKSRNTYDGMKDGISTIDEAMGLLTAYKKEFMLGYLQDSPLIINIYRTLTICVVVGISQLILIDGMGDNQFAITKRLQVYNSSNTIKRTFAGIVAMTKDTSFKSLLEAGLKKENFLGTVGTIAFAGASVAAAILAIRESVYWICNARVNLAEQLELQAQYVEINAETLDTNSDILESKKKIIIRKQLDRAKKLRAMSNKINIDFNKADKKTKGDMGKKVKAGDVIKNVNSDNGGNPFDSFDLA